MDQVFAGRQVCEKFLAKIKEVFWTIMDFKKVYDMIHKDGLWKVLQIYGLDGRLLKGAEKFLCE